MKKLFLSFILINSIFNLKAQNPLTIAEVFDFSVGDIFEYDNFAVTNGNYFIRKTITHKFFSNNLDTVSYYVNIYSVNPFLMSYYFNTSTLR